MTRLRVCRTGVAGAQVQYLADQKDLVQEAAQHRREEAAREKEEEDVARAEEVNKEMTFVLSTCARLHFLDTS